MGLIFRKPRKGDYTASILGSLLGWGLGEAAELEHPEATGFLGGEAGLYANSQRQRENEEVAIYENGDSLTVLDQDNQLHAKDGETDQSLNFDEVEEYLKESGADEAPVYLDDEETALYLGTREEFEELDRKKTEDSESYKRAAELLESGQK